MSELKDLLEEKRRWFTMPQDSFRALQERRQRRRNRRVLAGVLALLIAGAGVGGLYRIHLIGRAPSERTAAQPGRSESPGNLSSCKFIATFERPDVCRPLRRHQADGGSPAGVRRGSWMQRHGGISAPQLDDPGFQPSGGAGLGRSCHARQ
jgi:hypothetical protein